MSDQIYAILHDEFNSNETVLFRTREKETSERHHEMKAKETAVQFYKEKVIHTLCHKNMPGLTCCSSAKTGLI